VTIVKRGRGRDSWLDATVKNGKLLISVGVEVLAFAAQQRFDEQHFEETQGDETQADYCVIDPDEFARDVVLALMREEENGDNLVHLTLDKAIDYARDHGSLGVGERERETPSQSGGSADLVLQPKGTK
jgi:hypothetical protein